MTIWAKTGETITCVKGHPICEIARDINVGDERSTAADFTNWYQPPPDKAVPTSAIRCNICRGVWVRPDGYTFHFGVAPDDEWR